MNDICIIVPCYNEADRIDVDAFIYFTKLNRTLDFYFVNDGSTDTTLNVLKKLTKASNRFTILNLDKNVGKAEAIRQGVLSLLNNYKYLGYLDADLSTPLEEIERLYEIALSNNKPFVMGSRIKHIGVVIERRLKRHLSGRIIATIIDSFILKLGIYDTQCGAKIIEHNLAKQLFKNPFKTKWLFDVEIIARVKSNYGKSFCLNNIAEIPLKIWIDKGGSKIAFTDILKLPFNLIKIYIQYR